METLVYVNGSVDHIELDRYHSNYLLLSVGHELRTYNLENGRMSVIVGNQTQRFLECKYTVASHGFNSELPFHNSFIMPTIEARL